MNVKAIKALEALLEALKEGCGTTAAARPTGNRTAARTDYRGGNASQDIMDVARRAIRYARAGTAFSKKERNVARKVLKAFKNVASVYNTNGVDVWTHNGL